MESVVTRTEVESLKSTLRANNDSLTNLQLKDNESKNKSNKEKDGKRNSETRKFSTDFKKDDGGSF